MMVLVNGMESKYSRWIKRIRDTRAEEINCSVCLDQISQYVDIELYEGNAADRMPQIKQHLDQCEVCHEEYELLANLARLERDGKPPALDDLADRVKRPPTQGPLEK